MTKAGAVPMLVCGLAALLACVAWKETRTSKAERSGDRIAISTQHTVIPAALRALRPVYPYSVIPGGVYAAGELQTAMRRDRAVQQHYAGFDANRLRFVTLRDDCYRYVSYRRENQIYWTRKKLRIPKGEVLFTDGSNYSRTRCGNRLAEQARPQQVSALEPPADVLSPPPFQTGDGPQPVLRGTPPGVELEEASRDLPMQIRPMILPGVIPGVITGARDGSGWTSGAPAGMSSAWMPLVVVNTGAPLKNSSGGNSTPDRPPPVVPVPVPEPNEILAITAFLAASGWIARSRLSKGGTSGHIR